MKLESIHNAYFLGIGGIGMSAIARWFHHNGVKVAGYDRTKTALTNQLEEEGITIHYEDMVSQIPKEVVQNKVNSLVVYTPAIPKDHLEFNYLKKEGYTIQKRAQVLGTITQGMLTVAVAGTHGKTTTTSMIAHLLKHAGLDVAAFMGGISANYNTNLLINEKNAEDSIVVVEADEFDRSFLTLHPNRAVVTATDADHLDIYGAHEELKKSFTEFLERVDPFGKIYIKEGLKGELDLGHVRGEIQEYGLDNGEVRAENLKIKDSRFIFDAVWKDKTIKNCILEVPGYHNVENAIAAIAVADNLGLKEHEIKSALASYKGVKRRFEYLIKSDTITYIDDYAHHPKEIDSLLKSVKALYPSKKITVLFQPHLYSRTRDFAAGFSESLSLADEVLLLNIYPAREMPIPGITSDMLLENISSSVKELVPDQDVLSVIEGREFEVFLTVGAGNIDQFVEPIKIALSKKYAA